MFGLCDGRTEPVGRAEEFDRSDVMNKSVLTRERKVVESKFNLGKDGAKFMKAFKSFFHAEEGMRVMSRTSSNVCEVEEG